MILYHYNIKAELLCLCDKSYQSYAWLGFENEDKSIQSSFIESLCGLFDDTGLGDDLANRQIVFNEKIDNAFRDLLQLMKSINNNDSELTIHESPEMASVRQLSREILIQILVFEGSRSTAARI